MDLGNKKRASIYGPVRNEMPFRIQTQETFRKSNLKVLSSEMDLAEIGSFDRSLLQEVSRRLFRKIRLPPILREPFKVLVRFHVIQFTIVQQFR
jgi:hypothetical protein